MPRVLSHIIQKRFSQVNEDVARDALLDQMRVLHDEFNMYKKQPGEFTVKEYKSLNEIGSDRARTELDNAEKAGKVKKRKVGNRLYYSFVE